MVQNLAPYPDYCHAITVGTETHHDFGVTCRRTRVMGVTRLVTVQMVHVTVTMTHRFNWYVGVKIDRDDTRLPHVDGCRYNERRNAKTEGSKRLTYTGFS